MNKGGNIFMAALTAWRENRGGGSVGMQSVLNVIQNRAKQSQRDFYAVCTQPWQFSSITAKNDPQLGVWPAEGEAEMAVALDMAEQAYDGKLPDITGGATLYYAASMTSPPYWAAQSTKTVEIAGQLFFKENA